MLPIATKEKLCMLVGLVLDSTAKRLDTEESGYKLTVYSIGHGVVRVDIKKLPSEDL